MHDMCTSIPILNMSVYRVCLSSGSQSEVQPLLCTPDREYVLAENLPYHAHIRVPCLTRFQTIKTNLFAHMLQYDGSTLGIVIQRWPNVKLTY